MRGCITLNTSREILYDKFKRRLRFLERKPLNPETKDSRWRANKFCKFHKDSCHWIRYCRELAFYFNNLAKQGNLEEYVKNQQGRPQERCKPDITRSRSWSDSPSGSNSSERWPRKIMNVIYGGGSLGENGGYSRKVMMSTTIPDDKGKQTSTGLDISFSEEDHDHVMHSHEVL